MNLNIDIHNFSLVNINFLDTKKNIIMDGNFTKIIYSNQWFTVNSIFICFPIEWTTIEKVANKYVLRFNPYSTKNLPVVQDFARLEIRILEYFKTFFNLNVRISNSFSKQLYTGNMKIFKEYIGDYSSSVAIRGPYGHSPPKAPMGLSKENLGFAKPLDPAVQNLQKVDTKDKFNQGLYSPSWETHSATKSPSELVVGNSDSTPIRTKLFEGFAKPQGGANPRSSLDNPRRGLSADDEDEPQNDNCNQQKHFVIKVSGIWENYEEIGLTFKLMEQGTKFPL